MLDRRARVDERGLMARDGCSQEGERRGNAVPIDTPFVLGCVRINVRGFFPAAEYCFRIVLPGFKGFRKMRGGGCVCDGFRSGSLRGDEGVEIRLRSDFGLSFVWLCKFVILAYTEDYIDHRVSYR